MKRFMLVPESQASSRLAPDLRQKLHSYQEAKEENFNIPPHIRPQPLAKYDSRKWSQVIESDSPKGPDDPSLNLNEFNGPSLPKYAIAKANKVLPYLSLVQGRLPVGLDRAVLMTDLVTKRKVKLTPPNVLRAVVRALLHQAGFVASWLDAPLLAHYKPKRTKTLVGRRKSTTPKRRAPLAAAPPDGDDGAARLSQLAHAGRSGVVPTTQPLMNPWMNEEAAHSVSKKPAWSP